MGDGLRSTEENRVNQTSHNQIQSRRYLLLRKKRKTREATQSSWKMKSHWFSLPSDSANKRSCFSSIILTTAVLCIIFFFGSAFVATDYKQRTSRWGVAIPMQTTQSNRCKDQCRPHGGEALPKGIISGTSNLEMRPLWGSPKKKKNAKDSKSLLAIAVGIKQKETVDQIVRKFPSRDFTIMLFHYDGVVDEWRDLPWSDTALHISAINQTKWWFAKRFLHPDIVAEYKYIFLWDEDLGVENFHPGRYLSIIKEEGLEISQPALDASKSQVHHQITARGRRARVHRRTYKYNGGGRCYENSTNPPCTGWVEMMAPVFSRAAWRCSWYMIQNDLIHAWGLDMKLGYCAQGDRSKNVGVVDSEYIVHQGIPTLGGSDEDKSNAEAPTQASELKSSTEGTSTWDDSSARTAVRRRSYIELEIFKRRWEMAVKDDECWTDPYPQSTKKS